MWKLVLCCAQIGERGLECSGKYFSPLTGSAKSGFHGDDDESWVLMWSGVEGSSHTLMRWRLGTALRPYILLLVKGDNSVNKVSQ